MVDIKKDKVNDGIIIHNTSPYSAYLSGVDVPDLLQEDVFSFEEFTLVKQSLLRRLRVATFTDHWAIYAFLQPVAKKV